MLRNELAGHNKQLAAAAKDAGVGTKVRETIKDLGGTMPENLPKPDKGILELVSAKKKLESDE